MYQYYVNKNEQSNGDHEVHRSDCNRLPDQENRLRLGLYSKCSGAVREAKKYYTQSNGCYYCSNECHTT
ncbi:hypothetical protein LCGC14_3098390 [marine sediment metagenome]|uniref:Uncharacterized protein n=1 Tax=marine sediment metagenome TaxID=412755 RepID=A0A0F8W8D7_9ZZZZ